MFWNLGFLLNGPWNSEVKEILAMSQLRPLLHKGLPGTPLMSHRAHYLGWNPHLRLLGFLVILLIREDSGGRKGGDVTEI